MKSPDGKTVPLWGDIPVTSARRFPPGSHSTGVCVIGAGIAGLSCAYHLLKAGKEVVVIDEGPIGAGQTQRTSAHLSSAVDDRFVRLEKLHGEGASQLAYDSHAAAIDSIEKIAQDEKIDCEFVRVDGFLFAGTEGDAALLDQEFPAAQRAGARVERIADLAINGKSLGPALKFANQARFHPIKYLAGLAAAVERLGGRIFCGRRATDVQGVDESAGRPAAVALDEGPDAIHASAVVVCTNTPSPINDWMGIYLKQAAYRSYVIGLRLEEDAIPDALLWDTVDPYHYVRLEPAAGGPLLIVGGEDHRTGQFPTGEAPFLNLETWARARLGARGAVIHRWSGQVQEPADGLAYIGVAPTKLPGVYAATGDSGMGLTHGAMAGLIITDLILGRHNPWSGIYDPSRKKLSGELVSENLNTLSKYKDLVTPGQIKSADEVRPGEGAVMRQGLSKVAIYREPAGAVHTCSAICTHLQCVVEWNPVEKTWDCPCHGSRFDPLGKVLMGPAVTDLPKMDEQA